MIRAPRGAGTVCVRRTLDCFPDLARLHESHPARYPELLESVAHGPAGARHDILFAFPGARLTLRADGTLWRDGAALGSADFLATFDRDWSATRTPATAPSDLPFSGGWFVFLAYEFAGLIEPAVGRLVRDPGLPLAQAIRFPAAIIRDHVRRRTDVVCETGQDEALLDVMARDLGTGGAAPAGTDERPRSTRIREEEPVRFLTGVERILEYIRAGDVFQVNLSRLWEAEFAQPLPAAMLYRRLRATNPAPFAALATVDGGAAILSSSPERLVEVRDGDIRTRPIAGTYPRSADRAQDAAWGRELRAHPKERAEHVMLLDLERNDLGRLCRPGTVRVSEFMTLESYRHVHHLVSEVRGALGPEVTPGQVVRAVFPGGTITGCPKIRCMQIIAELERAPRGAYTGSLGYINRDGTMDLNILIRTIVHTGRRAGLRAGAGIVADSQPARELAETRAKARGLLAALTAT